MQDGWMATTSDGREHKETWVPNSDSPWTSLMKYCHKNNEYVRYLRLCLDTRYIMLPANQLGYWQAHSLTSDTEGSQSLARGIGYVAGTPALCHIVWGAYDHRGNPYFWEQKREPTDAQIIWSINGNSGN